MENLTRQKRSDYFIRIPALRRTLVRAIDVVLLAPGSGTAGRRIMAVLMIIGSVIAGFATWFAVMFFSAILNMWGSAKPDTAVALAMGLIVGCGGVAWGVLTYLPWTKTAGAGVADGVLQLSYVGFRKPLLVDRSLIRVVAVDDGLQNSSHKHKRFPVTGELPPYAFVDALDTFPSPPMQPPGDHPAFPIPSSFSEHEEQYLFSPYGVSLPVLRMNPEDVPNVAIIFTQSVKTPGMPLGLLPSFVYRGGRRVKGVMLRSLDARRLAELLGPWNVVRDVTAADVLAEDLRVGRPLRGWRMWVYAAILFMPLVFRLVSRLHHG
ncbi:MAG: hypothetical protein ABR548_05020 [Actinomycetota bacterium]